jgi:hypothetical protein
MEVVINLEDRNTFIFKCNEAVVAYFNSFHLVFSLQLKCLTLYVSIASSRSFSQTNEQKMEGEVSFETLRNFEANKEELARSYHESGYILIPRQKLESLNFLPK